MSADSDGFTLVEVVVALAILSLVMLTTVSGFRTLGNTAITISGMTARTDELRSVSAFLRDAFENSVPGANKIEDQELGFGGASAGGVPTAFFRVENNSVEWRSKILFGEAYGGSYFLRLSKAGDELQLRWQEPENQKQPGPWDKSPVRVVLENVDSLEVWTRQGNAKEWNQTEIGKELPSHIKLVIRANEKYWPELIMKVQQ